MIKGRTAHPIKELILAASLSKKLDSFQPKIIPKQIK